MGKRAGYSSDVSDEEWGFVVGYLALCREDAKQREHNLRAVFNGLRCQRFELLGKHYHIPLCFMPVIHGYRILHFLSVACPVFCYMAWIRLDNLNKAYK